MSPPLLALILDRIRERGRLTVAEYVDLALYAPGLGYYARAEQRSGRAGDFFTSVDLGPLFGELLATQFAEMWRIMGQPAGFDLVEAAAGNGRLTASVLASAFHLDRPFYESVRASLVERSAGARAAQTATLAAHQARLLFSGPDLPQRIDGVLFANELLDALPPHLVVMREEGLREVFVTSRDGRLTTCEQLPSTPALDAYLEDAAIRLQPGQHAEVNLAARAWTAGAARALSRGFLLLVDYGHEAKDLFSAARPHGTLTTFKQHAAEGPDRRPGWLQEPGERDITSQVDLTSIRRAAESEGLEHLGTVDQTYFLLGLGIEQHLARNGTEEEQLRRRLALKTLLIPGGIGSTHKVLVFGRGVGRPSLQGTSFSRRLT
jgi:SAM-dependent MidA family methyltransferase